MPCPVRQFLDNIDPADRAQFEIIINDRTRHVEMIARSIRSTNVDVNGEQVRKHQLQTCDCHGWVD